MSISLYLLSIILLSEQFKSWKLFPCLVRKDEFIFEVFAKETTAITQY